MVGTQGWETNSIGLRDLEVYAKEIQVARSRTMLAISSRYENPIFRMEMFLGECGYRSSWDVNEGTIVEAYSDNIFNIVVPVYFEEANRPRTINKVIVVS